MPLTKEECIRRLNELYGDKITLIGDFKGEKRKTTFRCYKHGEFEQTPYQLLTKQIGCYQCKDEEIVLTKKNNNGYWDNIENCQKEAEKHNDLKSLSLNKPFCYFSIVKNGWKNKITFKNKENE